MTARNNRLHRIILETIEGVGPVTRDDVHEMLYKTCPRTIFPSKRDLGHLLARMPELRKVGDGDGPQLYEFTGVGL